MGTDSSDLIFASESSLKIHPACFVKLVPNTSIPIYDVMKLEQHFCQKWRHKSVITDQWATLRITVGQSFNDHIVKIKSELLSSRKHRTSLKNWRFCLDFRPLSKSLLTARTQLARRYHTGAGQTGKGGNTREKTFMLNKNFTLSSLGAKERKTGTKKRDVPSSASEIKKAKEFYI